MPANKRSEAERERDRVEIARLYLRGWSHQAIADRVNEQYPIECQISRSQITYDIGVIVERWRESELADIDQAKARELAEIDQLEKTAWDFWDNSPQDAEALRALKSAVSDCIDKRARIWGLYAPTKTALTDPTGEEQAGVIFYLPTNGRDEGD
jgi:hypothetical protein